MANDVFDSRLVVGAGVAIVAVGTAVAVLLGSPVTVLVVSYAVLFGMAILLLGDDAFVRALNIVTIIYVATIVYACTFSPLPGSAIEGLPQTDRLNYYYIYYIGNGLAGAEENIEAGYLLLVGLARLIMSFEMYLAIIAVCVLASIIFLLRSMKQGHLSGIVALTLLSYFSFWSGALNITRQFVAAGIGFTAISIFLRSEPNISWKQIAYFIIIVSVAATIHSSAFIFVFFLILYALRKYGNRILLIIWLGNFILVGLNYINASPLSIIPGMSDRLARYDSSQISDESLAQFQNAGVTTGNRIDWALVLALPIIMYAAGWAISKRVVVNGNISAEQSREKIFIFALVYTTLCIPFYLLSFLTFGDRIAFYAFLILPAFLISIIENKMIKEVKYIAFVGIAGICVLQMAVGVYGYTPKVWITGLE